ncbi:MULTISPECIES: hypothetical protein [unclassified Nodularia (in: cyanobacteria)]|uniref:hypothetical protein n=1 Tax=unclassified Nodularia (in: cyanobacteria) TaxID=2656917 RepID=UPI00187F63A7|nr:MULTISPECIES: hypothetical protein [unclassified Nodularia (in: cyanobacteria)]MBE9200449.1 hypothetical protein [Nodularia sp. LEGE 06071]MCC2694774.1 hypothetical protein [Nodularia sp. LEGE 04288]
MGVYVEELDAIFHKDALYLPYTTVQSATLRIMALVALYPRYQLCSYFGKSDRISS